MTTATKTRKATRSAGTSDAAEQQGRREEMLKLCVAIGYAELADAVTGRDTSSEVVGDLRALAAEYVRAGIHN